MFYSLNCSFKFILKKKESQHPYQIINQMVALHFATLRLIEPDKPSMDFQET